jgi:hypothetical protein
MSAKPMLKADAETQDGMSAIAYAVISLVGLLFAIGLLMFYVYQVPRMAQSGVQNQVFYILLLPWGLCCAAFLFGAMRSIARFTHKKMGSGLELGGPVVLFCLVVGGGFKLVPSAAESFDLTVRPHSAAEAIISTGKIMIDLGTDRRSENVASNGEANFKGIPAKFKTAPVKVLAQIDDRKYKQQWQEYKLSGSMLDLPLEPAAEAKSHLSGTIIPPPEDWAKLRVTVEGQAAEAKVDELGRFDVSVSGRDNDEVHLLIYSGQKLVASEFAHIPGPMSIRLHP